MRRIMALAAVFGFSLLARAQGAGQCQWCLPPEFQDQIQVQPNDHYGHYMPVVKGKWYAMLTGDAEFEMTVTGDASTPDCETMEGEGHGMLCSFDVSKKEGQITVVIQSGTSPVSGILSIGRGAEEE